MYDRSFKKIAGLILGVIGLSGCSFRYPGTQVSAEPEWISKKVYEERLTHNQREYAVILFDETNGITRQLRLKTMGSGTSVEKLEALPLNSSDFLMVVPLEVEHPLSYELEKQRLAHEQSIQEQLSQLLLEPVGAGKYYLSVKVEWDEKKLQELRLHRQREVHPLSNQTESATSLKQALKGMSIQVLLDKTLPPHLDGFIDLLIQKQNFFSKERGDSVQISRVPFPKKALDQDNPLEKELVKQRLEAFLKQYIHPSNFWVNVKLDWDANAVSTVRKTIVITLNQDVSPDLDGFLTKMLPLQIPFAPDQGDLLTIQRQRFPELEVTPNDVKQQQEIIQEYFGKIQSQFESGNYREALGLIQQALQLPITRENRVKLLKMKGSLHFLRQEQDQARDTLETLLRIVPDDAETQQTLELLKK